MRIRRKIYCEWYSVLFMAIGAGFSVYVSECKPFHFTSLVMICLIVERTHYITTMKGQVKRRKFIWNQKRFNRLLFIIILCKCLSIMSRSFKTDSKIWQQPMSTNFNHLSLKSHVSYLVAERIQPRFDKIITNKWINWDKKLPIVISRLTISSNS